MLLAIQLFAKPHAFAYAIISAIVLSVVGVVGVIDWQDVNGQPVGIRQPEGVLSGVGWGLQAVTIGGFAGAFAAAVQALVTLNHPPDR